MFRTPVFDRMLGTLHFALHEVVFAMNRCGRRLVRLVLMSLALLSASSKLAGPMRSRRSKDTLLGMSQRHDARRGLAARQLSLDPAKIWDIG